MPADCGLDFEGISSPQSPAITGRITELIKVSLADSTDDCTGIRRGMTQVKGSEKVPTTPTTPTSRRQDLDQKRPSTRTSFSESQHILAKYTRYLKAVQWGSWLH